ncbi:hypothetical protein ACF0H5_019442 [Mactra antiquata]
MNIVTSLQCSWNVSNSKRRGYIESMPACVPINNNNVGDTNMVSPPTQQSDSKFSKIISCLFLKKKTDVVDMTKKETTTAIKKKKMAVDRSERSRRVLKMESMRAVPTSREPSETNKPPSPGQNQMFLPSENPTASFLSYLDPSVRRACADVMRSTSSVSHTRQAREAFSDGKQTHIRNTNYRGQQASENSRPGAFRRQESSGNSSRGTGSDSPPALPPRNNSRPGTSNRPPVVVPGIMASSDDDMGYNSDGEISDLHDEMRRMNMGHGQTRVNGQMRKREGSISLSEGSNPDEEIFAVTERPNNPSPGDGADVINSSNKNNSSTTPKKTMETVIDDLFQQTQNNIDTIYRNGLETMDIESNRPETSTPETCMRRLEADLAVTQPDEESMNVKEDKLLEKNKVNRSESQKINQHHQVHSYQQKSVENSNLDSLLTEVSIWAKDRQTWLLDGGNDPKTEVSSRESTVVSTTTDGRVIEQVSMSNKDKCNEWVGTENKGLNYSQSEPKSNRILTGPKLFRSALKTPTERRVSFDSKSGDLKKNSSKKGPESRKIVLPTKKHFGGVQIVDLNQENDNEMNEVSNLDILGPYPEPWTADMYASSTPLGDRLDRSTINDDISEPDERRRLNGRSPESWLSSNGSCSNLLSKSNTTARDDDSFEFFNTTPLTTPRSNIDDNTVTVTATNVGKSHQIIRQTPKVHTPFSRSIERQAMPLRMNPNPIPTKPMLRNTQLKPLTVLRSVKPKNTIDAYHSLPGMKQFIYDDPIQSLRNSLPDETMQVMHQTPRPFSEIPLRPDLRNNDRNSNILAHSSSLREDLEQYGVAETVIRPVSETLPQKRTDKIGVGPIMATKSKQTYARDVINAMERQRHKNNQEAFAENDHSAVADSNTEGSSYSEKKEAESGKKRHKVFTNSLIRGGYSYDKHSRKNNSDTKQNEPNKNSQKEYNMAVTSVNDLEVDVHGRTEHNAWFTAKSSTPFPQQNSGDENFKSENQSANTVTVTRGNKSQSLKVTPTQNSELKRGPVTTSFQNKYSVIQNHGLSVPIVTNQATASSADNTANKFRQIRSRRDQEMEWLMRDAAETEV